MKCLKTNIGNVPYENRQLFICDWRSIWLTLASSDFLSIPILFEFLSKFTACFLHCVCDAQIEKKCYFTVDILYRWCFIHFHQGLRKTCHMKTRSNWSQPKVWFGTKRNFSFIVRDQFKQIQKYTHSTKYSCIIHYFITFAAMQPSSSLATVILEKHSQTLSWWI